MENNSMRKITKMHEKCEKTKFCQENEKNKKKLRILCENLKKKKRNNNKNKENGTKKNKFL